MRIETNFGTNWNATLRGAMKKVTDKLKDPTDKFRAYVGFNQTDQRIQCAGCLRGCQVKVSGGGCVAFYLSMVV